MSDTARPILEVQGVSKRFGNFVRTRLPLLDRDVSDLSTLRQVGEVLYGN